MFYQKLRVEILSDIFNYCHEKEEVTVNLVGKNLNNLL